MKCKIIIAAVFAAGIVNAGLAQTKTVYNLAFNAGSYQSQSISLDGKTFKIRAFEKMVYVAYPVDTAYQMLNVYIPEAYFEEKTINGYTAATAPIFFPNKIGGYMPGLPATATNNQHGSFPGGMPAGGGPVDPSGTKQPSAVVLALSKGYVVASAGARGRTSKSIDGVYTGKAPADIVDLKAAIRYLKYNDKKMPGDANKIISNGNSAGGAMSVLLGATGNNADYEPYLKELGAAPATDDIFAVSAYCPITNLDHADMAYEWQFNGVNSYKKMGTPFMNNNNSKPPDSLSPSQIIASAQLKMLFPAYVNSLQLKDKNGVLLTLDDKGNGSFATWVNSYVIAAAQKAIDAGTDLSGLVWLTINNKKVTNLDFSAYVQYMERMKTPPAFDALNLSAGENQLFGNTTTDKQHFTKFAVANSSVQATTADEQSVKMMNPMYYIGQPGTKTARYWRIRHGTKDKDTGLGIPVILGTYLQNRGFDVDLALPWDRPHSSDYDLDELFAWMEKISKA